MRMASPSKKLQDVKPESSLTGKEKFVVGISASYWAHVPMFIAQVLSLRVSSEGVILVPSSNSSTSSSINTTGRTRKSTDYTEDDRNNDHFFTPTSKCTLVGTIIAIDIRSNGSLTYTIDDGTGLLDCLYWLESGAYEFPSLNDEILDHILEIGTIVRVLGKIVPVYMNDIDRTTCITEIHASLIEPIPTVRCRRTSLNFESTHVADCIKLSRSNQNAREYLDALGSEIEAQVKDRDGLPSNDDDAATWKVFGINCKCNLSYKEALLYCHCKATIEAMDPHFTFRDALLEKLLQDEEQIQEEGVPLRFIFSNVLKDKSLCSVAERIVETKSPSCLITSVKRLVLATFRALRNDGILYMLDDSTDTYLLISRTRVLEPYVRLMMSKDLDHILERSHLQKNRPPYLLNVPRARLQYIGKSISS